MGTFVSVSRLSNSFLSCKHTWSFVSRWAELSDTIVGASLYGNILQRNSCSFPVSSVSSNNMASGEKGKEIPLYIYIFICIKGTFWFGSFTYTRACTITRFCTFQLQMNGERYFGTDAYWISRQLWLDYSGIHFVIQDSIMLYKVRSLATCRFPLLPNGQFLQCTLQTRLRNES